VGKEKESQNLKQQQLNVDESENHDEADTFIGSVAFLEK
jgi:hypothetical protein